MSSRRRSEERRPPGALPGKEPQRGEEDERSWEPPKESWSGTAGTPETAGTTDRDSSGSYSCCPWSPCCLWSPLPSLSELRAPPDRLHPVLSAEPFHPRDALLGQPVGGEVGGDRLRAGDLEQARHVGEDAAGHPHGHLAVGAHQLVVDVDQ